MCFLLLYQSYSSLVRLGSLPFVKEGADLRIFILRIRYAANLMFHLPQITRTERRKTVLRAKFTDTFNCCLPETTCSSYIFPLVSKLDTLAIITH